MINRTLRYGEGLFETFRVYAGRRIPFVRDHLARMAEGARFFNLPFSQKQAVIAIEDALEQIPKDSEARLRLNLVCYGEEEVEKGLFETRWTRVDATAVPRVVRLGVAPFGRFSGSPLLRFKTTSYLENVFVLRWARSRGYFDAVFANERGEITEGSISNIFFVRGQEILTPPVSSGLLPGITRAQIVRVAEDRGIRVDEHPISADALEGFEAAFISNSVVEILPVADVGQVSYPGSKLVQHLLCAYREHVNEVLGSL